MSSQCSLPVSSNKDLTSMINVPRLTYLRKIIGEIRVWVNWRLTDFHLLLYILIGDIHMWYCNTCKLIMQAYNIPVYGVISPYWFIPQKVYFISIFFFHKVNPSIESEDEDDTTVVSVSDRFDWPRPWVREGGTWLDVLHHDPQS